MIALAVGLGVGLLVVGVFGHVLAAPSLARTNFRGEPIATAAGLAAILTVLIVEAVVMVSSSVSPALDDRLSVGSRIATVVVALGLGGLGLLDDLVGDRSTRGVRGHLGALLRGKPTTGSWKLVGGGAVALIAVGLDPDLHDEPARLLLAGALVALGANLGNLFDLAPGRTTKVATLTALPLVITAGAGELVAPLDDGVVSITWAPLVVLGAAWALLPGELGERHMLGDTGANVVGGAVALLAALVLGTAAQVAVVVVLVILTLASERVSFSRVIASTPPLRWIDELGRRRLR